MHQIFEHLDTQLGKKDSGLTLPSTLGDPIVYFANSFAPGKSFVFLQTTDMVNIELRSHDGRLSLEEFQAGMGECHPYHAHEVVL